MQFSNRQQKEFQKTVTELAKPPWKMQRTQMWLSKLLEDNEKGFSPSWVPPSITDVVSDADAVIHFADSIDLLVGSSQIPAQVSMQDTKGRATAKRTTPAATISPDSQRNRNLMMPTTSAAVAGAPEQAIAAAAVAVAAEGGIRRSAPKKRPTAAVPKQATKRIRVPQSELVTAAAVPLRISRIVNGPKPKLGCTKFRYGPSGCKNCRTRLDVWKEHHESEVPYLRN